MGSHPSGDTEKAGESVWKLGKLLALLSLEDLILVLGQECRCTALFPSSRLSKVITEHYWGEKRETVGAVFLVL